MDGSQMKKNSDTFTAEEFRSDMRARSIPVAEIEDKIAHARANPI
jgi:hypothetical protein